MSSNISETPHSAAVRATIEDLLKRLHVGDQVTWETLEQAADVPREGLYRAVRAACKRLSRAGYKFIVRRGIGVERTDDNGFATEVVPAQLRSGQRLGRRIVTTVASINIEKVEPARRASVIGAGTIGAWLEAASKPKAVKQLGEAKDIAELGRLSLEEMRGTRAPMTEPADP